MQLAVSAVSGLLPKLGSLLIDEYNLQKGVRGQIRFLKDEMERMQAALDMLSKQPADHISDLDKLWARDLKELSYDIEDSVDAFMVRVDDVHGKPRSLTGFRGFIDKIGLIKTKLMKKPKIRHRLAMDMEDIKTRIDEIAARRARYATVPATRPELDAKAIIDRRMTTLFEDVANLVGIDGPAERLSSLLTQAGTSSQKHKLMVASIVGVGGLGKTTLANLVYQRLYGQFQRQAFVSVSLKPDIKKILISILRQVSKEECKNAGEKDPEELIRDIRKCLSDKRYIIVIDDLWDESAWKNIKHALIDNNYRSRVIVTTRNLHVAKLSASPIGGALYELEALSDADSKRLFYKRVFNKEDGIHNELDEVAGKILKKCGGIPLAIVTIASLLACKPSKIKYEWYDVYRSIGSGLDKDASMENMRHILSLGYNELPSYLKPCLLYLSFFPEDSTIDKDSLVRRWVAEGLVDGHGRNLYELYDLGESYFIELVNRSFIQPLDIDIDGIPRSCRVHDVVLDVLISLSIEDNFVVRLDCQKLISPQCKIRRLSLQDNEEDTVPAALDVSHVRSVIAFGDAFERLPPLSRFTVVRVLDLEGFPSKNNHPKDLRRLHHLRYLQLRGYLREEVLNEIGSLQHLKILDLTYAYIDELPASIVQLTNLQSLLVHVGVKMPDGIGNLSLLQEISWIKVAPNTAAELGKLTEMRVLCVYGLGRNESNDEAFLQSLFNLGNLLGLFISRSWPCSLDSLSDPAGRVPSRLRFFRGSGTTFHQMPRWFSSLSELSGLTITVQKLTQYDLKILGGLPVLRFLQLEVAENGTTDEEGFLIGSDQPFQFLEEFKFKHRARCWLVFAQGVMARLQKLELYFQVSKRSVDGALLDIGLENLTSLKHATIIVDCYQARIRLVEDVETKIRNAFDAHPNNPAFTYHMEKDETLDQQSLDMPEDYEESNNDSDASEQR